MGWTMAGDYILFVFMVSLGVLQFAASWGRLEGISFFPRRYLGYIFAAVMVSVGYWWFFRIDRNVPDTAGGISGPWLFAYLVAGLAIAIVITLLVSSAVKARWGRPDSEGEQRGLEVLKRMTFIQAIIRAVQRNS
jgi:uncharacterized membrane protein